MDFNLNLDSATYKNIRIEYGPQTFCNLQELQFARLAKATIDAYAAYHARAVLASVAYRLQPKSKSPTVLAVTLGNL